MGKLGSGLTEKGEGGGAPKEQKKTPFPVFGDKKNEPVKDVRGQTRFLGSGLKRVEKTIDGQQTANFKKWEGSEEWGGALSHRRSRGPS